MVSVEGDDNPPSCPNEVVGHPLAFAPLQQNSFGPPPKPCRNDGFRVPDKTIRERRGSLDPWHQNLLDPRLKHSRVASGWFPMKPFEDDGGLSTRGIKTPQERRVRDAFPDKPWQRKKLSVKARKRGMTFHHHPRSFPSAIKRPLKLRRGNVAQSRISGKAFMAETVAVGFCGLR